MGYLGKISAILTANPINMQKGLSTGANSVKEYGQTVSKNIRSSMRDSEKSFSGILTQAQKLKASLDAALSEKLKFKGFAGVDKDIQGAARRATELQNAAEGIAKPLGSAAAKFSQMSHEIQASFMPALAAAQQSVKTLHNEINSGTRISKKNFSDVANQALAAAAAIERISEAQQLANQTKVSKSFAFVDPASEDSLRRMALLQKQASSAPLEVRVGKSFQKAQLEVEKLSQRLVNLTAQIENHRSKNKNPSEQMSKDLVNLQGKVDAATAKLSGLIPVEAAVGNSADIAAKKQQALAAAIHATVVAGSGAVADPFSARTRSVEKLHAALMALPDTDPMKASGLQFVGEMVTRAKVEEEGISSGATTRDQDALRNQSAASAEKDIAALAGVNAKLTESDAKAKKLKDENEKLANSFFKIAEAARLIPSNPFAAQEKAFARYQAAVMAMAKDNPRKAAAMSGLEAIAGRMDLAGQRTVSGELPKDRAAALAGRSAASLNAGADKLDAERKSTKELKDETDRLAKGFYAAAEAALAFPSDPFAAQTKAVERYKAAVMALADSDPRKAAAMSGLDAINARVNLAGQRADSGALPKDRAEALAGRSTASLNAGADRLKDNGLGKAMTDASRQTDTLKGKILALKGQLDSLPESVRTKMIPAIQDMESKFNSGVPAAISKAIGTAKKLEMAMANVSKASSIKSAKSIINEADITRSIGRLSGMESVLLKVGAKAGSSTAKAFDKLAYATKQAVQAGTLGLPETIALLDRLEKEAVQAAVATGQIGKGDALMKLKKGGDVGRTGMNNFSMGLNQAMFAVDDFFSSVGGAEQKIRAVSNNITQLGFVVGNTTGLLVALAAVVGAQLALAYYKYVNQGRSAEDVTNALNEALSRQKSLLESLTQAYDSLADSIGKTGMSDRGQKEAERKKEFDDIRKKQKELRDEDIQSLDPTINMERANQAKLKKDLEKEETVGGRIIIQQKIKESQDRERQRKEELSNSKPETVDQSRESVRGILERAKLADVTPQEDPLATARDMAQATKDAEASANAAIPQGATAEQQIQGLRDAQKELREIAANSNNGLAVDQANIGIAELEVMIKKLEEAGTQLKDKGLVKILESLYGVADVLKIGQDKLKEALGEDIGSSVIAEAMDKVAKDLQAQVTLAKDNPGNLGIQAQVKEQKAALEKLANSLSEAALNIVIFSTVMKKISDTLQNDMGSLQQLADKAREEDIRLGTPETADRRKEADDDLRAAENEKRRIENNLKHAREKEEERLRADPALADKKRKLEAEIADPKTSADRRLQARTELDAANDATRSAVESSPAVVQAQAEMDAATKDRMDKETAAQERDKTKEAAIRGREAAMTGEEQRSADLKKKAVDLAAASAEAEKAQAGSGQALAQQGAEQMGLAAAPMLAGFRDEVMNARLQGPSRQALKVSDTTTSEGQAELQRLLRGDDAAKDINLVELRQQTASLREIERLLKDEHNIIVDL